VQRQLTLGNCGAQRGGSGPSREAYFAAWNVPYQRSVNNSSPDVVPIRPLTFQPTPLRTRKGLSNIASNTADV
jgi:hypothetical protein